MNRKFAPERCPICGGKKNLGETVFTADLQTGVVVVRKIPALICSQCGEEWLDNDVANQVETLVNEAKRRQPQVEVLTFPKAA